MSIDILWPHDPSSFRRKSYLKSSPVIFAAFTARPMFTQHAPHIVHGNFSSEFVTVPLYVFKCNPCDQVTEILQKFGDPSPECAKCSKKMKKSVALTSFSLKGGGWAKDNYGLKDTG